MKDKFIKKNEIEIQQMYIYFQFKNNLAIVICWQEDFIIQIFYNYNFKYKIILLMSNKIKAAIRVRPFLPSQVKNGYVNNAINVDKNRKQITINEGNSKRVFHFDHLFSQNEGQQQVYKGCGVDHLLDKSIEGYHCTIFAYGQTGSGKTHTMQGAQSIQQGQKGQLDGLIPKIINNLYLKIKNQTQRTYTISVSFLQIYNERIYDLLNPSSLNPKNVQGNNLGGLRLRWNKNEQFSVQNLFVFQCKSAQQLTKFFLYGLKNRISSAHKLNMQSSRSHSIMTIRIQSFPHSNPNHLLASRIQLVDLAGSQRIGMTGTEGKLAKQSIDINKSLFTLRQVISILAQLGKSKAKEKTYVPYRDSKLTSILKQSIGGNSYSLMIACINPHDVFIDQNLSTLTYATKASYITNIPVINDDPRTKIINQLRKQVKQLNNELIRANQHIQIINNMQNFDNGNNKLNSNSPTHSFGVTKKPSTQISQKLDQQQQKLPQPIFKKRLTQKVNANYDQFSQRLVESINMVRQLLKSNKQLREQLEINNKILDEKDLEIYQLSRENEILKQKGQFDGPSPFTATEEGRKSSNLRHRNSVYSNASNNINMNQTQGKQSAHSNPMANGNIYGFSTANSKNNFNYWNSVQINQYYMNERGIDSMPTNFNRREVNSAQDKRIIQSRGAISAEKGDRNAITAKISKRNWLSKNSQPKKFLSFYNDPTNRDEVGFY